MRNLTRLIVNSVSIFGAIIIFSSLYYLFQSGSTPYYKDIFILSLCFFILSPWSVRMTSGAAWRPAIMIVIISVVLVPPSISFLVALPGLIRITSKAHGSWRKYFLSFGHIGLGLMAGGAIYRMLNGGGALHFSAPLTFFFVVMGILGHFVINRLISFFIVADKAGRDFKKQFILMIKDLHWGYLNLYVISLLTIVAFAEIGYIGIFISILLLLGIYRSARYYTKMQQLQHTVYIDPLTNVENRTAWEAFIQQMGTSPKCGTIAMLDLDNFKLLNDTLGHAEGDKVLKITAAYIQNSLRHVDRIFRYGGDEFILYLPHDEDVLSEANKRIELLTTSLNALLKKNFSQLGVSMGSTFYNGEKHMFKEVIKHADQLMYEVKEKRKYGKKKA
jgi:diguanylate cyclase (GGDEF)-like protein